MPRIRGRIKTSFPDAADRSESRVRIRTQRMTRTELAMPSRPESPAVEPTRDEVERLAGPVVLEFGTEWCGHCKALAPRLAEMLARFPTVRHIKVDDGPGRPLGRSFRVKLWPTLVFLRDGKVLGQVSRPQQGPVLEGLRAITGDVGDEASAQGARL
jgi:thioredoxin 1